MRYTSYLTSTNMCKAYSIYCMYMYTAYMFPTLIHFIACSICKYNYDHFTLHSLLGRVQQLLICYRETSGLQPSLC